MATDLVLVSTSERAGDCKLTIDELKAACREPNGLGGDTPRHIYLTIPRTRPPRGRRIHLSGSKGPMGDICTVRVDEGSGLRVVAVFDRKQILDYLEKAGL